MFGRVKQESSFDVSEGYVPDVYPEGGERVWEVRIAVIAADDVSELPDGFV